MFIEIDKLISIVKQLPKDNFYFLGIKEHSVGLITAPPKVGKTTFAENLGMCIASGHDKFLGKKVWVGQNRKVLMIGLEEFYKNRTERNEKQLAYLDGVIDNSDWHNNFIVSNVNGLRYITNDEHWEVLKAEILKIRPALTIIDSLSRLHGAESIEESSKAIPVMRKIRELAEETETTLIVIHHTHKLAAGVPLVLSNVAGSRIISQEADFIIGMNKTVTGKRYVKPLGYRYMDDDIDKVLLFKKNEDHWLEDKGEVEESTILREFDNRVDTDNKEKIYSFIVEKTKDSEDLYVSTKELKSVFVGTDMSEPTMHSWLNKLEEENKIIRAKGGKYRITT